MLPGRAGQASPERPASRPRGLAAPLALPAGFAALLTLGAVAAGTGGSVGPLWILIIAGVIVTVGAAVAEPAVAPLLGAIGWLTVVGFSQAPYAQLHMTGALAGQGRDHDDRLRPGRCRGGHDGAPDRFKVHTMDCGRSRGTRASAGPAVCPC